MSTQGQIAVKVVQLFRTNPTKDLNSLWMKVAATLTNSQSVIEKGCPRNAFLGLCEAGDILGIPPGRYATRSRSLNKTYALDAVACLRKSSTPLPRAMSLWQQVVGSGKKHNEQMNVVLALWEAGLIRQL